MTHLGCHYFAQNLKKKKLAILSFGLQYRLLERKVLRMDYNVQILISSMSGCISIFINTKEDQRNIKMRHH